MGLDPKFLDSLPMTLVNLYAEVEMDILADMARRIATYDYFIPAAQHQNQKLQELGMMQEEIIKRLSALTGQTQAEIVALLTEAGEQAVDGDLEYYKAAEVYAPDKVDTEALYEQLNSGLIQTEGAFKNITRTTARTGGGQLIDALDRAWLQINTGAFDYNTSIRRAIIDLSEKGLGAVKYPSGRVDNIEVAVRRAVVTGANQTAAKTQEKLADQLEVELVEVTAHGGARPEHAKWQGQVFSRHGDVKIDGVKYKDLRKATRYGYADGLCGVNCRHNFHPYVPGASRTWSDKELAKLEEKSIEYNGVKMTEYEASQVQRKMEREIRKQKRAIAALDAAGEDAIEYRSKLRKANKAYSDFTAQTGLKQQRARTQIAKPAQNTPQKPKQAIANSGNSGTITLPDFDVPRSVGAKAKNYKIKLPNGEEVGLTEGTRVTNVKVIAGKGRDREIDILPLLVNAYKGTQESEWQKVKGLGYVDYHGESYKAELHWYEEPSVGRVEWKVKPDADGNWFRDED